MRDLIERGRARAAAGGHGFDYELWDLYARVTQWYEADKARESHRQRTLHALEQREGETARIGAMVATEILTRHLLTMQRLGDPLRAAAARERHPRAPLLGDGVRAAEGNRDDRAPGRGQGRRLLGDEPAARRRPGRLRRVREDHRPLRRHGDLRRQGHRLPALEVRPARGRLRLPPVRAVPVRRRERALGDRAGRRRRSRCAVPRRRHAGDQRHRRGAGLPAARGQGGAAARSATRNRPSARSTSPTRRSRSRRRPHSRCSPASCCRPRTAGARGST